MRCLYAAAARDARLARRNTRTLIRILRHCSAVRVCVCVCARARVCVCVCLEGTALRYYHCGASVVLLLVYIIKILLVPESLSLSLVVNALSVVFVVRLDYCNAPPLCRVRFCRVVRIERESGVGQRERDRQRAGDKHLCEKDLVGEMETTAAPRDLPMLLRLTLAFIISTLTGTVAFSRSSLRLRPLKRSERSLRIGSADIAKTRWRRRRRTRTSETFGS